MIYFGSRYYSRACRRNGWGKFVGWGHGRQGKQREYWFALFGRSFWIGSKPK